MNSGDQSQTAALALAATVMEPDSTSAAVSSPQIPAVIFCDAAEPAPAVVALTTLDRLLVAAHRAGCQPIYVVAKGAVPRLRRAPALGIAFTVQAAAPNLTGPVFLASTRLFLLAADVRRLVEKKARLVLAGRSQPAGCALQCSGSIEADLAASPALEPIGVAADVSEADAARATAKAYWASLTSSSDGTVDRHFNRPAGRFLSKLLVHTAVTPNQISVAATILGVVAAGCFAMGSRTLALWGAVLLQLSAIIDCVDGDVARAVFKESALGKWLDIVGDQIVHISVFVALGVGLWRAGVDAPVLALATSAGIGVVLSFSVILRTILNPTRNQNSALQRLIDATTNRDFSVLLLFLAVCDRLVWFLWLAGIGVHVFWILALSLQLFRRRAPVATA